MRSQVLRASVQSSRSSGSRKAGRWQWQGLANSDGADDETTDQPAAAEPSRGRFSGWGHGTLGLRPCSSRWSSAAHRRWRRPAVPAGNQQAVCRRKGFLGDQPGPESWLEPPGRRGGEGKYEGGLRPPRKCSLYGTRPKSVHLSDWRPMTQVQAKRSLASRPAFLQRSSRA